MVEGPVGRLVKVGGQARGVIKGGIGTADTHGDAQGARRS